MSDLTALSFSRSRFVLRSRSAGRLPPYLGSTLRGGLGAALVELVGDRSRTTQERSLLSSDCPYLLLYGDPELDATRGSRDTTRAFVLRPPTETEGDRRFEPGDALEFELVLLGRAQLVLPWLIVAARRMGSSGLGRRPVRFDLDQVLAPATGEMLWSAAHPGRTLLAPEETDRDLMAPVGPEATVRFLTPVHLLSNGEFVPAPSANLIVRAILRRLHAVMRSHCDAEWDMPAGPIIDDAACLRLAPTEFQVRRVRRFSNRQRKAQWLEGVTGELRLASPVLPRFGPLLRAAEVLNIGKHVAFGFGRISVD